ncbi:hypothetical protein ACN38_g11616, partial [Penicillium nordicum]
MRNSAGTAAALATPPCCATTEKGKKKKLDKSGIRTHASCETRKLLLVMESRYTLTWRLRPTRPSYQR